MNLTPGLAIIALLMLATPREVSAQVCNGYPAPAGRQAQVAAGAAAFTYANVFHGSVSFGGTLNGTLGVARVRDGELFANAYDVGLAVGYDARVAAGEPVFVCPVAAMTRTYGPRDFVLRAIDYGYLDRALGVGLAFLAVPTDNITLIPFSRVSMHWMRLTRTVVYEKTDLVDHDRYGQVTAGIGIVFDRLTLRPTLSVPFGFPEVGQGYEFVTPFGREDGELSLGVSIGVTIGKSPAGKH